MLLPYFLKQLNNHVYKILLQTSWWGNMQEQRHRKRPLGLWLLVYNSYRWITGKPLYDWRKGATTTAKGGITRTAELGIIFRTHPRNHWILWWNYVILPEVALTDTRKSNGCVSSLRTGTASWRAAVPPTRTKRTSVLSRVSCYFYAFHVCTVTIKLQITESTYRSTKDNWLR